jgi:hypothetical protein
MTELTQYQQSLRDKCSKRTWKQWMRAYAYSAIPGALAAGLWAVESETISYSFHGWVMFGIILYLVLMVIGLMVLLIGWIFAEVAAVALFNIDVKTNIDEIKVQADSVKSKSRSLLISLMEAGKFLSVYNLKYFHTYFDWASDLSLFVMLVRYDHPVISVLLALTLAAQFFEIRFIKRRIEKFIGQIDDSLGGEQPNIDELMDKLCNEGDK